MAACSDASCSKGYMQISTYLPPTNEASRTLGQCSISSNQQVDSQQLLFPPSDYHLPWLPVSRGDIKKTAQTRFVNSSPQSYRLMPASVESSETDRTSFVEKASHKFVLPVSYFLEIAKLWAISNRSELECQFTTAKSCEEPEPTPSTQGEAMHKDGLRPICHEKAAGADAARCPWSSEDKGSTSLAHSAEHDLLHSINRFLESCRKKDKCLTGIEGLVELSNNVGSETRRYLSQIMSLTSKNFAFKLVEHQNGVTKSPEETRKRAMCDDLKNCKVVKEEESQDSQVNVFAMSSSTQGDDEKEQLVIIHIPTSQKKKNTKHLPDCDEPRMKRTRKIHNGSAEEQLDTQGKLVINSTTKENAATPDQLMPDTKQPAYTCFYCTQSFIEKRCCARHMLSSSKCNRLNGSHEHWLKVLGHKFSKKDFLWS